MAALKDNAPGKGGFALGVGDLAVVPVTWGHVSDQDLIERLAHWRERDMEWFPTQFRVTHEGTRDWLRDSLLEQASRVMFLVVDADDRAGPAFGHFGFDDLHDPLGIAQLSNTCVGERSRMPSGAMEVVERALIAWARRELGVSGFWGVGFIDNIATIRLHDRLGQRHYARIPLRRRVLGDRVEYRPCAENDTAPPDRWWLQTFSRPLAPRHRLGPVGLLGGDAAVRETARAQGVEWFETREPGRSVIRRLDTEAVIAVLLRCEDHGERLGDRWAELPADIEDVLATVAPGDRERPMLGLSGPTAEQIADCVAIRPVDLVAAPVSVAVPGTSEAVLKACADRRISVLAECVLDEQVLGLDFGDLLESLPCRISELAVAWALAQPAVRAAVVGARTPDEVRSWARADLMLLEPGHLDQLAAVAAGSA